MGFLCSSTTTPTTSSSATITGTPEWLSSAGQGLTLRAADIANTPYQAYGGTRIADFNPDELSAFDATRANMGSYMPGLSAAFGAATQGSQSVLPNIQNYMNPYTTGVLDVTRNRMLQQFAKDRSARNAQFSQPGVSAFGGARQAIAESEANQNLQQNLTELDYRGLSDAFTQAGQLFNADAARQLQASDLFKGIGTTAQSAGLTDAAALQTVGQTQRDLAQKGLDLGYSDFVEQRDWPKDQASWLSQILSGTAQTAPKSSTTTTTGTQPGVSPLGQLAGAGMTGLSLYKLLGMARGGRVRYSKGGAVKRGLRGVG